MINIVIAMLLVIVGIIALLLFLALFMKREHYVRRSIIVDIPRQKVFDYLRLLKNQDQFNKHAMVAPDREKEFKGTDGTVGYIYAWKGDKNAGEGEKEIKNIIEGERIEMEIRFVKPMHATASIIMETEGLSDNQTKVYWSNAGTLKYPMNLLVPMLEKHVVKDMDTSLSILKDLLEKQSYTTR
jgi:hypothetical protein